MSTTLTAEARTFLARQRVAHLATSTANGAPHVVPVCFAIISDTLYVAIDEKPKSVGQPLHNYYVDIEPGINWDITPNISVNPYLNIYPNSLTMNATSINMILTAKAF